jgi:ABC-type dipeptide/oligopeptide/nickel transport system permease component
MVLRLILRRLLILVLALVLVNFLAFSYALIAQRAQRAQNPFGSSEEGLPPIGPAYQAYARGLLAGDFGRMPVGVSQSVAEAVTLAARNSLGLLAMAASLSVLLGLVLGMAAVRVETGWVRQWLVPLSAVGLAMPTFYVGALMVMGLVSLTVAQGEGAASPLPVYGFGWDSHLVLPVLALMVRPTVQVAALTAGLLSGELTQQYIVAARSRGNSWRRVRWRHALRLVLGPVVLAVAGSLRWLLAELVVVEWLFGWPGLGRLLAQALIAPRVAGHGFDDAGQYFLNPPLVAALLALFTLLFLLVDSTAVVAARASDPRLAKDEG